MQGWCLAAFGLGLILGHWLESWLLCCGGGSGLILLGVLVMHQR